MICQLHCFPFFGEGSKVSRLLLKSEFSAMKMDLNFTLVSVKNIIRSYWDLYFDFKGRRIKRTSSCNHVMQTLTIKCRFLWNKDFGKRKCFKEIWIETCSKWNDIFGLSHLWNFSKWSLQKVGLWTLSNAETRGLSIEIQKYHHLIQLNYNTMEETHIHRHKLNFMQK